MSSSPQHIKEDAADLVKKLLKYNPSDRLPLVGKGKHAESDLQLSLKFLGLVDGTCGYWLYWHT